MINLKVVLGAAAAIALCAQASAARPRSTPHPVAPAPRLTAAPVPTAAPTLAPDQIRRIDAAVTDQLAKERLAGISLSVARGGTILYSNGYGYRNLESRLPALPATVYEIGALTEGFTAAGILALQQDGKLAIDDPVSKYLPGLPFGAVTLRDLLGHTSGIRSFTDTRAYQRREYDPGSPSDAIAAVRDSRPSFAPGTRWAPSPTDYVLLGSVSEKVSVVPYGEFIYDRFTKPLSLGATGFNGSATESPDYATGYTYLNGQLRPVIPIDLGWGYSAFGMVSTVLDIAAWDGALLNGKALSQASYRQMFGPTILRDRTSLGYGFGFNGITVDGRPAYEQHGSLPGFSSENVIFAQEGLSITLMANGSRFDGLGLAKRIRALITR